MQGILPLAGCYGLRWQVPKAIWLFFHLQLPKAHLNWWADHIQQQIDVHDPYAATQLHELQGALAKVNSFCAYFNTESCRPRMEKQLKPQQNSTVVWQAGCGCYRVAKFKHKGVLNTCIVCSGKKCYCKASPCGMCGHSARHQQSKMLGVTKHILKLYSDIWLITEAPVTFMVKGQKIKKSYDCMVVFLKGDVIATGSKLDYSRCMLAIELDGTSHSNAFSREGCKAQGQEHQDLQDKQKEDLLMSAFSIKLLRFTHTMTESQWQHSLQLEVQALV